MAKIPKFKSKEEMAQFWETNDFTDYADDTVECDDTFKRPNLKATTLRLDPLMVKKLKAMARKKGLSYNAYARVLLMKAFKEELAELRDSLKQRPAI